MGAYVELAAPVRAEGFLGVVRGEGRASRGALRIRRSEALLVELCPSIPGAGSVRAGRNPRLVHISGLA